MRRMVGVLRRPEEAPALAPQPSLEQLDRLVEHAREAGLPVELRIEGDADSASGRDRPDRLPARPGGPDERDQARRREAGRGASFATRRAASELTVTDDGRGKGRRRTEAGTAWSACASACRSTAASSRRGPRPEGGFRLRAPSRWREPMDGDSHRNRHLPLLGRRGLDGAPAQAARRLRRRSWADHERAAARRPGTEAGGPRARRRRRLVLRRLRAGRGKPSRRRWPRSARWPRRPGRKESSCESASASTPARRRSRATSTWASRCTAPPGSAMRDTAGRYCSRRRPGRCSRTRRRSSASSCATSGRSG